MSPLRRWAPVMLWASLIFVFSTEWFSHRRTTGLLLPLFHWLLPDLSPAGLRALHAALRKLAHFSEFLVLSVLLYRALRADGQWEARLAGLALALAGAYAVTDELHQAFVPGRTAAVTDCLIDFSGAVAGQFLIAATRWRPAVMPSPSGHADARGGEALR